MTTCGEMFNCCNCGGADCGCRYCYTCNACEHCERLDENENATAAEYAAGCDHVINADKYR